MIRYVMKDTHFRTSDGKVHLMRKDDRVAIYPPAIHKDPEIFEEPSVSPSVGPRTVFRITCVFSNGSKGYALIDVV